MIARLRRKIVLLVVLPMLAVLALILVPHLVAGESKEVSFEITPDMLKFYNIELKHVIEPGDFQIMVGANSREVKTLNFNVK